MATPLEMTLCYGAAVVLPYLTGSIPFGFLIGRIKGVDIRTQGSGNIGATNALLVRYRHWDDPYGVLPSLAALSTVCGHIYPVYLRFHGGKGISTAAGAILALNPPSLLSAGVVWAAVFFLSRYVSLASILAAVSLPVFAWIMRLSGVWICSATEMALFCVLALLALLRHASNIKRLLNGTENRFSDKGKSPEKKEGK